MKLDIKAMGAAFGILWGGLILLVGIFNIIAPGFGEAFLELPASVYPGFRVTGSFGQVVLGTLYGLIDGFIGGAIFAFLYNLFVPDQSKS